MLAAANLLIIGGSGFIGGRLVTSTVAAGYTVSYTYTNQPLSVPVRAQALHLNILTNADTLKDYIAQTQPAIVVYAAVPSPQNASLEAHEIVSVAGVRRVISALAQYAPEALLVYISTNTVFGGGRGLYREDEQPDPQARHDPYTNYALTKARGEQVAQQLWPNTIIARTSVVDGRDAAGVLYPRLAGQVARLKAGQPLLRFGDRYFSPTLVDNLVETLLEVLEPDFEYRGVLHLVGSQRITDYELARCLARTLRLDEALVQLESMRDSPTMAQSPRDNSLDITFTQSLLRTRLLDVEEQLKRIFGS